MVTLSIILHIKNAKSNGRQLQYTLHTIPLVLPSICFISSNPNCMRHRHPSLCIVIVSFCLMLGKICSRKTNLLDDIIIERLSDAHDSVCAILFNFCNVVIAVAVFFSLTTSFSFSIYLSYTWQFFFLHRWFLIKCCGGSVAKLPTMSSVLLQSIAKCVIWAATNEKQKLWRKRQQKNTGKIHKYLNAI